MRLVLESRPDGRQAVRADCPDPVQVVFEIEGSEMRGVHIDPRPGSVPLAVPFTMSFMDEEVASRRGPGFAMVLAGQLAESGQGIRRGGAPASSTMESKVDGWESFLAGGDADSGAESGADDGAMTISDDDYGRYLEGGSGYRLSGDGYLFVKSGAHLGVGSPLSGFGAIEAAGGDPEGFDRAAAEEALASVHCPSSAAVAWYGLARGEQRKLRLQAARSFPVLAGMIAECSELARAVDAMEPLGEAISKRTGLTKGGLKRIGRLRGPLVGDSLFGDGEVRGEDALGVDRTRRFRVGGSLTVETALRRLSAMPPDRVPGDDDGWAAFQDIHASCAVPLSNAFGIPQERIMDASGGDWSALKSALATAADFEGEFDRTAMALTAMDSIEAVEGFARGVALPLALSSIEETGEPLPEVDPCFMEMAVAAAADAAMGASRNIAGAMFGIARRYASRIPALMEIEGRFEDDVSDDAGDGMCFPNGGFPLLSDEWTDASGIVVVPLRNAVELEKEGTAMSNCVGSYAGRARRTTCHIFSLRNGDGERLSTLEISMFPTEGAGAGPLSVVQHRARRNMAPPKIVKAAGHNFLMGLHSGAIPVNADALAKWREHIGENGDEDGGADFAVSWDSILEFDWTCADRRSRLWEEWKSVFGGAVGKMPHPGALYRDAGVRGLVEAMSPSAAKVMRRRAAEREGS